MFDFSPRAKAAFVTLAAVGALAGCAKDPVAVAQSNNASIPVATLFNYKGCEVNRFMDNGRFVYFTLCSAESGLKPSNTQWSESCGKSCTQDVEVPTIVQRVTPVAPRAP